MKNDTIKSKLEYEYERFYMECMCLSRPGIFAKSAEIELKKSLTKILKRKAMGNDDFPEALMVLDNILEDVYCYVLNHQNASLTLDEMVDQWMESVIKKEKLGGIYNI